MGSPGRGWPGRWSRWRPWPGGWWSGRWLVLPRLGEAGHRPAGVFSHRARKTHIDPYGQGWPGKRLVGPAALFANTLLPLVETAFMRQPMAALLTLLHGRHQQKLTAATPNIHTERRCSSSKLKTSLFT